MVLNDIKGALRTVGQYVRAAIGGEIYCGYGVVSGALNSESGYMGVVPNENGAVDNKNRLLICEKELAIHLSRGDEISVGDQQFTVIGVELVSINNQTAYARVTLRQRTATDPYCWGVAPNPTRDVAP